MSLNTTSFFNSNEVHISSRMNEYMKKNFGYEVEGDIDTLREAKKSLEAEQSELKKHSYMNAKYMENMLMIETISSLVKAHDNTSIIKEDANELEYGDTEEEMAKGLGMSQDDFWELAERIGIDQYGGLTKDNYEDVMNHIVDNADRYTEIDTFRKSSGGEDIPLRNFKVGDSLVKEDSSESVFSIRAFKNAEDPSKDGLEITKIGGMGGTVIIKNQKELKDLLVALKGNVDNLKEAYNPETGRDPNVDTTEWDELIAKAKKKQEKEYANSKEGKRDPAYRYYHKYKTKESIKEDDDEEKGAEHYRWKNDSQLAVVIGRIEGAIDELDNAIQYRGENSAKFFNNGDKAGVGGLMGIKQKLEDIHSEWDKNTEYYGM